MKNKRYKIKKIIMLVLRLLCVILFPLSYVLDYDMAGKITFFTVQSNILVLIIMIGLSVYDILILCEKNIKMPKFMHILKLVSTTSITLTFVVFGIILTPLLIRDGRSDVVLSYSSIVMHQFIPLVALVDWIIGDNDNKISYYFSPVPVSFALYYFIFTMIASNAGVTYPSYENGHEVEAKFPYFFLNYIKYGLFEFKNGGIGVAYWLVIMAIIIVFTGFILVLIKNLQYKYKFKKSN